MAWTFFSRPTIQLYQPDADAVFLVMEGRSASLPMKVDRRGNWTLRLRRPLKELHGRRYYVPSTHGHEGEADRWLARHRGEDVPLAVRHHVAEHAADVAHGGVEGPEGDEVRGGGEVAS